MRLGIMMPVREDDGSDLRSDSLPIAARRIEEAGFDGLWANDSIGRPSASVDPLTVLASAAACTKSIELGTAILQLPVRAPAVLAHHVMSTHLLCGGRLVLGIGAGSTRTDFDVCGVDFGRRFELMDEGLAAIRDIYRDGADPKIVGWKPVAAPPNILLGSWGGAKFIHRAAKEFDGWIGSAKKGRDIFDVLARFRDAGGGRAIISTVDIDLDGGSPAPGATYSLHCPPAVARDRFAEMRDAGFDDVVVRSVRTDSRTLERIRALL